MDGPRLRDCNRTGSRRRNGGQDRTTSSKPSFTLGNREEPLDVAAAISRVPGDTFLIVDCLTLWLSNLMEKGLSDEAIGSQSKEAATSAAGRVEPTVAVSNEVGAGIVPANALARRFRNLLGRMNSQWADAAEKSLLLVAGRAVPLEDPTKLLLGKHA